MSRDLDRGISLTRRARDPSYIPHILAQLPPSRDFRAEMQYNNMCYALLHHIVDVLSPQRSLARFVQDRFLEPLGMGQTTYNHTAAQATGRRAHNFAQVGRDPVACKDASWRTTSNGSAPLIPPKSCTGEARTTGWFLDEGDDGLHLAGWAGIVTSASDLVSSTSLLASERASPRLQSKSLRRNPPGHLRRRLADPRLNGYASSSKPRFSPAHPSQAPALLGRYTTGDHRVTLSSVRSYTAKDK